MEDFWSKLTALGIATLAGGLVGLERELHKHGAGLRTHMMVSIGAAVFVLAASGTSVDGMSRVIQGIASGIGFIGAGTILKLTDRLEVRGLTTASSIWLAAAVGAACGMGLYLLALTATALSVSMLAVLGKVTTWFPALGSPTTSPLHDEGEKPHVRKVS